MNVGSGSFIANWEDALYVSGYLLDVFTLSGQAETTETEEFAGVGSAGTPLPAGWTGTASGNYTTATSSGTAIPSIGLKNNNEWLQTKTYPAPVSKFTFMYRYPSAATGSSFLVHGLNANNWLRIDSIPYNATTAKTYPTYNFTSSQNYIAFKFTYKKSAGNLAIDDVAATYGSQDTVYVYKNKAVTGNQFEVTGLNEQSFYYYKVRSILGSSASGYSETIDVQTTTGTALKTTLQPDIHLTTNNENILIWGLKGNETVRIYTTTGVCIYQQNAKGDRLSLSLADRGIFIVKVQNNEYRHTAKFIR